MFSKILTKISYCLVIIGALNWGLVGLFDWNVVGTLFGEMTFLTRLIYILVGLGGVLLMVDSFSKPTAKMTEKP